MQSLQSICDGQLTTETRTSSASTCCNLLSHDRLGMPLNRAEYLTTAVIRIDLYIFVTRSAVMNAHYTAEGRIRPTFVYLYIYTFNYLFKVQSSKFILVLTTRPGVSSDANNK